MKIIGIIAGEASGDILGAGLIKALRKHYPDSKFVGLGGARMIAEGFHSLYDMERLSVMGLIEPLLHLPDLFKLRSQLYQYFLTHKPDVVIGIDSPEFNISLELKLRKAGIKVVHYVSPSVWAWRQKRIFKIKKAVDLMLTLFPFEAKYYEQHHVPVKYVGHPLADLIPLQPNKLAARRALNLDEKATYIAILPGSRRNEIKYLADVFVATANLCWQQRPHIKFITSAVSEIRNREFKQHCQRIAPNLPITFYVGRSHDVLAAADVVLVTSGTATLETLFFKRPMVIAFRMAALTFQIARRIVKVTFIGLPNLLANKLLAPEFIQNDANPENMSAALLDYLDHPEKVQQLEEEFLMIHKTLKLDASERAAQAIQHLASI